MNTKSSSARPRLARAGLRPYLVACLGVAAGAFWSAAGWADTDPAASESVEVSNVYYFGKTAAVPGVGIHVRDYKNRVVNYTLSTDGLTPGHAYSIWIAVFNNPWFCSDECGVNDLESQGGDPRVDASVFWGGGVVAGADGHGSTALTLFPGATNRELFAMSTPSGLRPDRIRFAVIHMVLRDHGPATAGMVAEQLGTANQACLNGPPAPCFNAFATIHIPR
jgi:hypothetical protein